MEKLTILIKDQCFSEKHLEVCKLRHAQGVKKIYIQLLDDSSAMVELFHIETQNKKYIFLDESNSEADLYLDLGFKFKDLSKKGKEYALDHLYFIENRVRLEMDEKRFKHTLEVAKLAKELAIIHHLNPNKAYLMGLLHDVSKQWDKEIHESYMKKYFKEYLEKTPSALFHQHTALIWIEENLGKLDNKILQAISHHGDGESNATYAMVLFIADKIEPTRGYDVSEVLALCKKDLKKGFKRVKKDQHSFLKVKGVI